MRERQAPRPQHNRTMHRWDPVCAPARGLVRPVRPEPAGGAGPTRHQVAGPGWVRTSHGFYVPAEADRDSPEQRVLEQSVRLPAGGAVTGWAGCRLHRAGLLDGLEPDGRTRMPVPLLVGVGGRIRADEQVRLLYRSIPPWEVVLRYGVPTACLVRSVLDAMRLASDEREATVALDMVLATRLVSPERIRAYAATHRTGGAEQERVDFALSMCSEHMRSPNESRLHLVWRLDAGLPPVEPNRSVHSPTGRLLGIADLLDETAGLAVEFDGADHREGRRHTKDVRKQEAFFNHGLEVCRVTGDDLRRADGVVQRLVAARTRALRLERPRSWVLRPRGPSIEEELREQEDRRMLNWELETTPLPAIEELHGLP